MDRGPQDRCGDVRVHQRGASRARAAAWQGRGANSRRPHAARGHDRHDSQGGPARCKPTSSWNRKDGMTVMPTARLWMVDLGLSLALGACGVAGAWFTRRYTGISARNVYPLATVGIVCVVACALLRWPAGELVALPLAAPWIAAATAGPRWRQSDLGAGEELGAYELARRWLWEAPRQ